MRRFPKFIKLPVKESTAARKHVLNGGSAPADHLHVLRVLVLKIYAGHRVGLWSEKVARKGLSAGQLCRPD